MASPTAIETRRIFISSTTLDLAQYREVAQQVIENVSTNTGGSRFTLKPVSMTIKTQDGERTTPLEVSRAWVRNDCDWVVLIVAWNYGYVPPGASCSVTESEYDEATAQGKKVFVFMPAEKSDAGKPYRASDSETEDLLQWRVDDNYQVHRQALEAFKAKLRGGRFDLFRNLADFRERLAETLRQNITEELIKDIAPTIGELGLNAPLRACLDEVILLARLKRLHDTLHQIRQFGIRAWREELAASWPADGTPPDPALIKYLKGLPNIVKLVERISNVAAELPDSVKLGLPRLSKVVSYEPPSVPECGRGLFTDSIDGFAARVQRLFTDCDTQMGESAGRLEKLYRRLADKTGEALDKKQIADKQAEMVRTELDRSMHIHERLQSVLLNHRKWQRAHDEFEDIDTKMQSAEADDGGDSAEGRQRAFARAAEDFLDSGGRAVGALLAALPDVVNPEHKDRAARCQTLGDKVKQYLDKVVQDQDLEDYGSMRKNFDDLFFEVDLETLAAVESAEARVRGIEAGLQASDDAQAPVPVPA